MEKQGPHSPVAAVAAALVLVTAVTLSANGGQFFVPAQSGPVDLVYFARVKDADTGRPIQRLPYVTIVDGFTGIYVPFLGDSKGHFRSPDVGAAIKELTTQPIDTRQLEITISAPGYETVKVQSIPRQSKGIVELRVKMKPKTRDPRDGPLPAIPESSQSAAAGMPGAPADSSKPTFFLLGACFGLAAIAAVARTAGRPASTGH